MLYEFMCGKVPFGDEQEDSFYIFEEILNTKPLFPKWINDNKLVALASYMLDPVQKNREKINPQWLLSRVK